MFGESNQASKERHQLVRRRELFSRASSASRSSTFSVKPAGAGSRRNATFSSSSSRLILQLLLACGSTFGAGAQASDANDSLLYSTASQVRGRSRPGPYLPDIAAQPPSLASPVKSLRTASACLTTR